MTQWRMIDYPTQFKVESGLTADLLDITEKLRLINVLIRQYKIPNYEFPNSDIASMVFPKSGPLFPHFEKIRCLRLV